MKRKITFLCAVFLCIAVLAGCGDGEVNQDNGTDAQNPFVKDGAAQDILFYGRDKDLWNMKAADFVKYKGFTMADLHETYDVRKEGDRTIYTTAVLLDDKMFFIEHWFTNEEPLTKISMSYSEEEEIDNYLEQYKNFVDLYESDVNYELSECQVQLMGGEMLEPDSPYEALKLDEEGESVGSAYAIWTCGDIKVRVEYTDRVSESHVGVVYYRKS